MSRQQKSKNEALLYAELLCIIKDISYIMKKSKDRNENYVRVQILRFTRSLAFFVKGAVAVNINRVEDLVVKE